MNISTDDIIQKYSNYLAQANHDKILLEAEIDNLNREISDLRTKYEKVDKSEEVRESEEGSHE